MQKIIITLLILTLVSTGSAVMRIVPDSYRTIQFAINAARDTDTIMVMPGTYYENLVIEAKNIVVGSMFVTTGDELYIDSTIIDGGEASSVITMTGVERGTAAIAGLTIANGLNDFGGGLVLINSSPLITHCHIVDNDAYDSGGGILILDNCYPIVSYCYIAENETNIGGGGGAYCVDSGPFFEFCVFSSNCSDVEGGGGVHNHNGDSVFINCTITGNTADGSGGAVWCTGDAVFHVTNCIFFDNDVYEISLFDNNQVTVSYSDIEGGQQRILVYGESIVIWGTGNIDANPLMVSPGEGDFHLLPDSPCIDTGDPRYPLDPDNTRSDMGAMFFNQAYSVETEGVTLPAQFGITSIYPNPFNSSTSIKFRLAADGQAVLSLLDINGRMIYRLLEGRLSAGEHEIRLDASGLPCGLYFTRIVSGSETRMKKLTLLK